MKQYQTYLFDADGTLLDTTELIYQSFLNTCRIYGNFNITREEVCKHIGIPLKTQLELYLGKKSHSEYKKVMETHRDYQLKIYNDTLRAYDGVVTGLKKLQNRGVQLGIVSSRTRESLDCYLKHVEIFDYFTVLSTPERTTNHKPHPEPVLWAMEQFKTDRENTVFIGDAVFDIESGNSAGVDTALIGWGHNNPGELNCSPDYILNSFEELLN